MTWYDLACAYVAMNPKLASAKYRKEYRPALTCATPAMPLAAG
jgi:hypothetical protein